MDSLIHSFVESLAGSTVGANVFNPYSPDDPNNEIRKRNLTLYLKKMAMKNSQSILVGEAIGYQGARLSGVPLSSEYLMIHGVDGLDILGQEYGYQKTDEFDYPKKEPTATIVWEMIKTYDFLPLLWNAYPFHPFKDKGLWSNRTPSRDELQQGGTILKELIAIFSIQRLIAMGNKAYETLCELGFEGVYKVRHPAHGGKRDFIRGIQEILNS